MASVVPEIDPALSAWIRKQPMYFVGSAPSGDRGHVNVSPKGEIDTLAVLGPTEIAYLDFFGSGIETVSHVKQNGRIVVMLCAFDGPPRVVRLHGPAEVVEMADERFPTLRAHFTIRPDAEGSVRSILRVDVERISDSCGFAVPRMTFATQRGQLFRTAETWQRQRGDNAIPDYCDVNNGESIDGLPGLRPFRARVAPDERAAHAHEGRKL
jgi:hypothetical protein